MGFCLREGELTRRHVLVVPGKPTWVEGLETAWRSRSLLGPVVNVINAEFIITAKDPAIR